MADLYLVIDLTHILSSDSEDDAIKNERAEAAPEVSVVRPQVISSGPRAVTLSSPSSTPPWSPAGHWPLPLRQRLPSTPCLPPEMIAAAAMAALPPSSDDELEAIEDEESLLFVSDEDPFASSSPAREAQVSHSESLRIDANTTSI